MGDKSGIEWTDATWNPIVGCSIVSPGCTNCYAMRVAGTRLDRPGGPAHYAGTTQPSKAGPVWTGKVALAPDHILAAPLRWRKPRRIFVNSMGDLFHEAIPDAWIDRVFAVMALVHRHTFQVLTKRAARLRAYLSADPRERIGEIQRSISRAAGDRYDPSAYEDVSLDAIWPLANVWLGVSAEDQARADQRIPDLLATPAAVRFISAEPLLGPVDLRPFGLAVHHHPDNDPANPGVQAIVRAARAALGPQIDWVIVGGESGPGARPMHPDWARSLRDQCQAAGVPFFFKQWGEWLDSDTWLDCINAGPGQVFDGGAEWRPPRPLNYEDAERLAAAMGREGKTEAHSDGTTLIRIGKAAAGRLLDGREWNEFPAAVGGNR